MNQGIIHKGTRTIWVPLYFFIFKKNYMNYLIVCLLAALSLREAKAQNIEITFLLITLDPVKDSEIYIAGNNKQLGNWQPNSAPLQTIDSVTFSLALSFPPQTHLEFKFTQGSWHSERLETDGRVPENYSFTVKKDTTLIFTAEKWGSSANYVPVSSITGHVISHPQMSFEGIRSRDILVWLPPDYQNESDKRYPVLYMHDGQNTMDRAESFLGNEWRADEVTDSLINFGRINPIIIVSIYNTPNRSKEYSDTPAGRLYQKFLVEKLKPFIDENYRTLKDAGNTVTMGSSMGGLLSFLLAWNFPDIFGNAACLSPAFIDHHLTIIDSVEAIKVKKNIKIYIDNGGVNLEKKLQPGCDLMVEALQNAGYKQAEDLLWFMALGANHNEKDWSERLWRPLEFFFGKDRSPAK